MLVRSKHNGYNRIEEEPVNFRDNRKSNVKLARDITKYLGFLAKLKYEQLRYGLEIK